MVRERRGGLHKDKIIDTIILGVQTIVSGLDVLISQGNKSEKLLKLKRSVKKTEISTLKKAKKELAAAYLSREKRLRQERNKRYYQRRKKRLGLEKKESEKVNGIVPGFIRTMLSSK